MLKVRIIPKLLVSHGRTVKGVRFENLRDTGHPVTNARIYDAQGADELIFLDITASVEGRDILCDLVSRTASEVFMPFSVGGGVRTVADFRRLLLTGADKVAVNTAAIENPGLLRDASRLFGAQCVLASIDFRRERGGAYVYSHGGRTGTGQTVLDHARRAVDAGAGEILLTSIDNDGTMSGYDIETTDLVSRALPVPVIASGGAGTLQHLVDAVRKASASAVAIGSLFHFTDQSPIKVRAFMRGAGLDVRPEAA